MVYVYIVKNTMNHQELETRLMHLVVNVVETFQVAGSGFEVLYLKDQVFRASVSAVLNYSEGQSAESRKDFSHKCSLVLKELRETHMGLRILQQLQPDIANPSLDQALHEVNQLVAIFTSTIKSLKKEGGNI